MPAKRKSSTSPSSSGTPVKRTANDARQLAKEAQARRLADRLNQLKSVASRKAASSPRSSGRATKFTPKAAGVDSLSGAKRPRSMAEIAMEKARAKSSRKSSSSTASPSSSARSFIRKAVDFPSPQDSPVKKEELTAMMATATAALASGESKAALPSRIVVSKSAKKERKTAIPVQALSPEKPKKALTAMEKAMAKAAASRVKREKANGTSASASAGSSKKTTPPRLRSPKGKTPTMMLDDDEVEEEEEDDEEEGENDIDEDDEQVSDFFSDADGSNADDGDVVLEPVPVRLISAQATSAPIPVTPSLGQSVFASFTDKNDTSSKAPQVVQAQQQSSQEVAQMPTLLPPPRRRKMATTTSPRARQQTAAASMQAVATPAATAGPPLAFGTRYAPQAPLSSAIGGQFAPQGAQFTFQSAAVGGTQFAPHSLSSLNAATPRYAAPIRQPKKKTKASSTRASSSNAANGISSSTWRASDEKQTKEKKSKSGCSSSVFWAIVLAMAFGFAAILLGPELVEQPQMLQLAGANPTTSLEVALGLGANEEGALSPSSAPENVQKVIQLLNAFPESQQAEYFRMSVGEFRIAMKEVRAREQPLYVASGMCFGLAVGGVIGAFRP